jgi:hypothetical protein
VGKDREKKISFEQTRAAIELSEHVKVWAPKATEWFLIY